MRPLLAVAVVVCLAVASAAPVPKAVKKADDADRIVGTWKPPDGKSEWFRFEADGTMTAWVDGNPTPPFTYTYTLDPTATPKRMTWAVKGEKTPYYRGVYELDGDRLAFVYVSASAEWPAKVAASCGPYFNEQTRDTTK